MDERDLKGDSEILRENNENMGYADYAGTKLHNVKAKLPYKSMRTLYGLVKCSSCVKIKLQHSLEQDVRNS